MYSSIVARATLRAKVLKYTIHTGDEGDEATVKRLGGWDATFIYSDTANVPTHTMKIALVDTSTVGEKFTYR